MQHTTWPVVPSLEPITFELLTEVGGGCHPPPAPPPPPPAPASQVQQVQIVQAAPQYVPVPQYVPMPMYWPRPSRASAETSVEIGTSA